MRVEYVLQSLETSLRTVTASVDIAIAVWMSVLLIQQRRPHHRRCVHNTQKSGVGWTLISSLSTNRMIFHLIVVTVITGMWTAVIAVVDLLLVSVLYRTLVCTLTAPHLSDYRLA